MPAASVRVGNTKHNKGHSKSTPAGPDGVNVGAVGDLDNEGHIGVIVIVCAPGHLHKLVSHANVLRIDSHVLWGCHCHKCDCALIAKGLVCPAADGADELDSRYAVVGHEHAARHY